MSQKSILLISSSAPYSSPKARETLDIALAAGVFDQDVSVLLMGDGVFQLSEHQQPERLEQKNISKTIKLLPMYGVEKIYAQKQAIHQRQLKHSTDLTVLNNLEIQQLIRKQDVVINL